MRLLIECVAELVTCRMSLELPCGHGLDLLKKKLSEHFIAVGLNKEHSGNSIMI